MTLRGRNNQRTIARKAEALHPIIDTLARVAITRTAVLIVGEDQAAHWLAAAIHQSSPRGGGPFIHVNCAEMASAPLAYELFGWPLPEGGTDQRIGRVGEAHAGTLLLQNIEQTDSRVQFRLAEVLNDRQYIRTGEDTPRPADIRLIASAATRLDGRVTAGQFRADLFYHFNVACVVLPAGLRKGEDFAQIFAFFRAPSHIQLSNSRLPSADNPPPTSFNWSPQALEVGRALERVFIQKPDIAPEAILPALLQAWIPSQSTSAELELPNDAAVLEQKLMQVVEKAVPTGGEPFEHLVARLQRMFIEQILQEAGGVEAKAAQLLGISPPILASKMRELGLQ